ncbi:MAG TPA: sulfurtransferase [Candidatus Thermoplasmatota archaeon]|nr:sulfurtransferase [Candidatus Thermoplasmatota archaeon]
MARPPWTTLVDAESLAEALRWSKLGEAMPLVVLDCRHVIKDPEWGARAHAEGHIPSALHAHTDRDLSSPIRAGTGRHPLPDVDAFIETCTRWGIAHGTQVVAYDDAGGVWASRAWWLLNDHGHRDVAVLDGGLQAWIASGLALEKGPRAPPPAPRRFTGRPGHMPTVSTWDLLTRAPRCLMDARATERYLGEVEPIDRVAGHIPHAKSMPTGANLDKDLRFLPPDALRERYLAALDGLPPKDAAFYCGSGVTAPHDILAMHVAGLPGAALYPGSYSEWIRNPMRPVAKGKD